MPAKAAALSHDEAQYLAKLVAAALEHYRKEQRTLLDIWPAEIKVEHEYEHFVAELLKKLEKS